MTPDSLAASKPRSGWAEQVAIGIRRDHRVNCPRSKDRRPRTGRCKCPYSWWQPQVAGAARVRARSYGNFREAQTLKIQQEVVAHAQRVEIENAVRNGRNEIVTVYSHCLDWLRRGRKRWEETTFVGREGMYRRQLHETFGAIPIKDVTVEMIEAWINQRVTEVGYASARGGYYCLTAIFNDAIRRRVTDWNPAEVAELPPEPVKNERDYLTESEYATLVAACRDVEEVVWVRLAGEAALRRAGIAALKANHIDLDTLTILVEQQMVYAKAHGPKQRLPKGGRARIVAISPSLATALRDYMDERKVAPDARLLTARRGGDLHPGQLSKYVARIIVRAGFRTPEGTNLFSIHALRRTAATLARLRGVSPEVIRDQLGHTRMDVTTTHYVREHTNPRLAEFASAMDGVEGLPLLPAGSE